MDIAQPDLFSRTVNGEGQICAWGCLWDSLRQGQLGEVRPSENLGNLLGKIGPDKTPGWMVALGLAPQGQSITTFIPGKLIETIAIGLLATLFSTAVAMPLSFLAAHNIMARVPGGAVIYYVMRTFFNIVRAVDTMIWCLLLIVWVGLGSFAGVLALTIHSIAALAKLYSEEIEHIDLGPVEAVTAAGANLFQVIRYAVIPQIVPPFLAYTLLRWDINMRMATVVGIVAGGGIGFFVLETIRKGGYQQYGAALWTVAVVIILVDYISSVWRERILKGETKVTEAAPKPFYRSPRAIIYTLLGLAAFVYLWDITKIDLRTLFEPAPTFISLLRDFVTIDLSLDLLETVTRQMLTTIFLALLATTYGALAAIPFSFLAARNLTGRSRLSVWIYYLARSMFNVLRSIDALLYVAIFVFWVGIGTFAGSLALAITSFALIGKLFADAIENIDIGPMEAVTATGATRLQAIVYGILPQIVPPFISYSIYQWDINVRMATVIGLAGGGGIGLLLNGYFGLLQYHKAGTVVLFIVIVVAVMDFASAKLRERLV
jgi:phosphonate ABC transporter permease subunit PhnE